MLEGAPASVLLRRRGGHPCKCRPEEWLQPAPARWRAAAGEIHGLHRRWWLLLACRQPLRPHVREGGHGLAQAALTGLRHASGSCTARRVHAQKPTLLQARYDKACGHAPRPRIPREWRCRHPNTGSIFGGWAGPRARPSRCPRQVRRRGRARASPTAVGELGASCSPGFWRRRDSRNRSARRRGGRSSVRWPRGHSATHRLVCQQRHWLRRCRGKCHTASKSKLWPALQGRDRPAAAATGPSGRASTHGQHCVRRGRRTPMGRGHPCQRPHREATQQRGNHNPSHRLSLGVGHRHGHRRRTSRLSRIGG